VTAEKSDGEDQFVVSSPTAVAIAPPAVTLQSAIENSHGIPVLAAHATTASLRISNEGNVTATGTATIELFASDDTTLDDTDSPLGMTVVKKIRIRAGGFSTFAIRFVAPTGMLGGEYYVLAKVTSNTTPADTNADTDIAVGTTRPG
jgi:hypothetical protein